MDGEVLVYVDLDDVPQLIHPEAIFIGTTSALPTPRMLDDPIAIRAARA